MLGKIFFPLLFLMSLVTVAEPIRVVTEELPPFNYLENGRVEGLSSDVVRATLDQAGLEYHIDVMSWVKAYFIARFKPNILIYSIAKTPQRTELFRWIGRIVPFENCLFRLERNKHLQIHTLEDAKKFKVGVAFGTAGEQLLISKGFKLDKNLIRSPTESTLIAALDNGSIDLWLAVKEWELEQGKSRSKEAKNSVVADLCIPGEGGLYMAISKATATDIGDKLRAAYSTIKANGVYQKILSKHNRREK